MPRMRSLAEASVMCERLAPAVMEPVSCTFRKSRRSAEYATSRYRLEGLAAQNKACPRGSPDNSPESDHETPESMRPPSAMAKAGTAVPGLANLRQRHSPAWPQRLHHARAEVRLGAGSPDRRRRACHAGGAAGRRARRPRPAQRLLGVALIGGPALYGPAMPTALCEARQWLLRAARQEGPGAGDVAYALFSRPRPAQLSQCERL
ncbi:hypothetical protein G6F65_018783 [Rhizopus arrhizus]|nr:hypothetical protein G6F65_018783 [Rhizopus arrhizus]